MKFLQKLDSSSNKSYCKFIVNHTVHRLISVQTEVLELLNFSSDIPTNIYLIIKWGCDGAAGQSQYKQVFKSGEHNDSYLFTVSLVPLCMTMTDSSNKKHIIWQNMKPSSTRHCRPIKIMFKKETQT